MGTYVAPDQSIPGGVVHNPASPFSREMAKFEMDYSPFGPPGRPRAQVGYQAYPARYFKVKRSDTNGDFIVIHETDAENENQGSVLESQGYRNGLPAAIAYVESLEQMVAVAAAERNYRDRNMSESAKAESDAAEAATGKHLAEVPVTPIKRRTRGPNKPKVGAE